MPQPLVVPIEAQDNATEVITKVGQTAQRINKQATKSASDALKQIEKSSDNVNQSVSLAERSVKRQANATQKVISLGEKRAKQTEAELKATQKLNKASQDRAKIIQLETRNLLQKAKALENDAKNIQKISQLTEQQNRLRQARIQAEKAGTAQEKQAILERAKANEIYIQALNKQKVAATEATAAQKQYEQVLKQAAQTNPRLVKQIRDLEKALRDATAAGQDTTFIDKRLKQLRVQAEKSVKAVNQLDQEMNRLSNRSQHIQNISSAFSSVINSVVAMGAAIYKVSQAGIEFEKAMSKVGQVGGLERSSQLFGEIEAKAKQLGTTTAFTATQIAEGFAKMVTGGMRAQDALVAIEAVVNLAGATGTEIGKSGEIVIATLNQFGLAADEATRVADVMVRAWTTSSLSVERFAEGMKKVAPTAKNLGISLESTTATLSLLNDNAITGSQAGNQMAGVMKRLTSITPETAKVFEALGLNMDDFKDKTGAFIGIEESMRKLKKALQGFSDVDVGLILNRLLGSKNVDAAQILLASVDDLSKSISDYEVTALNAAGAAEQYHTALDNTAGKIELMKSALDGVGQAIFSEISPALNTVIEGITEVANAMSGLIESENLFAQGFVGAAKAIGILVAGATVASSVIGVVKLAMVSFGAAAAAVGLTISGPVVAAIAAVVAGIGALIGVLGSTKGGAEALGKAWDALIAGFKGAFVVIETLAVGFAALFTKGKSAVDEMKKTFLGGMQEIEQGFQGSQRDRLVDNIISEGDRQAIESRIDSIIGSQGRLKNEHENLKELHVAYTKSIKDQIATNDLAIKGYERQSELSKENAADLAHLKQENEELTGQMDSYAKKMLAVVNTQGRLMRERIEQLKQERLTSAANNKARIEEIKTELTLLENQRLSYQAILQTVQKLASTQPTRTLADVGLDPNADKDTKGAENQRKAEERERKKAEREAERLKKAQEAALKREQRLIESSHKRAAAIALETTSIRKKTEATKRAITEGRQVLDQYSKEEKYTRLIAQANKAHTSAEQAAINNKIQALRELEAAENALKRKEAIKTLAQEIHVLQRGAEAQREYNNAKKLEKAESLGPDVVEATQALIKAQEQQFAQEKKAEQAILVLKREGFELEGRQALLNSQQIELTKAQAQAKGEEGQASVEALKATQKAYLEAYDKKQLAGYQEELSKVVEKYQEQNVYLDPSTVTAYRSEITVMYRELQNLQEGDIENQKRIVKEINKRIAALEKVGRTEQTNQQNIQSMLNNIMPGGQGGGLGTIVGAIQGGADSQSFANLQSGGYAAIGQTLGNQLVKPQSKEGSALSGALQGAQMGSVAGPWGAAIGGVVGAAKGFFDGQRKEAEAHNKRENERVKAVLAALKQAGQALKESIKQFQNSLKTTGERLGELSNTSSVGGGGALDAMNERLAKVRVRLQENAEGMLEFVEYGNRSVRVSKSFARNLAKDAEAVRAAIVEEYQIKLQLLENIKRVQDNIKNARANIQDYNKSGIDAANAAALRSADKLAKLQRDFMNTEADDYETRVQLAEQLSAAIQDEFQKRAAVIQEHYQTEVKQAREAFEVRKKARLDEVEARFSAGGAEFETMEALKKQHEAALESIAIQEKWALRYFAEEEAEKKKVRQKEFERQMEVIDSQEQSQLDSISHQEMEYMKALEATHKAEMDLIDTREQAALDALENEFEQRENLLDGLIGFFDELDGFQKEISDKIFQASITGDTEQQSAQLLNAAFTALQEQFAELNLSDNQVQEEAKTLLDRQVETLDKLFSLGAITRDQYIAELNRVDESIKSLVSGQINGNSELQQLLGPGSLVAEELKAIRLADEASAALQSQKEQERRNFELQRDVTREQFDLQRDTREQEFVKAQATKAEEFENQRVGVREQFDLTRDVKRETFDRSETRESWAHDDRRDAARMVFLRQRQAEENVWKDKQTAYDAKHRAEQAAAEAEDAQLKKALDDAESKRDDQLFMIQSSALQQLNDLEMAMKNIKVELAGSADFAEAARILKEDVVTELRAVSKAVDKAAKRMKKKDKKEEKPWWQFWEDGGVIGSIFANGGILGGVRHAQGGVKLFKKDGQYLGEAEEGEGIIPRQIMQQPGFRKFFEDLLLTNGMNFKTAQQEGYFEQGGILEKNLKALDGTGQDAESRLRRAGLTGFTASQAVRELGNLSEAFASVGRSFKQASDEEIEAMQKKVKSLTESFDESQIVGFQPLADAIRDAGFTEGSLVLSIEETELKRSVADALNLRGALQDAASYSRQIGPRFVLEHDVYHNVDDMEVNVNVDVSGQVAAINDPNKNNDDPPPGKGIFSSLSDGEFLQMLVGLVTVLGTLFASLNPLTIAIIALVLIIDRFTNLLENSYNVLVKALADLRDGIIHFITQFIPSMWKLIEDQFWRFINNPEEWINIEIDEKLKELFWQHIIVGTIGALTGAGFISAIGGAWIGIAAAALTKALGATDDEAMVVGISTIIAAVFGGWVAALITAAVGLLNVLLGETINREFDNLFNGTFIQGLLNSELGRLGTAAGKFINYFIGVFVSLFTTDLENLVNGTFINDLLETDLVPLLSAFWSNFIVWPINRFVQEFFNVFNGTFWEGLEASDLGKIAIFFWDTLIIGVLDSIVQDFFNIFNGTFVEGLRRSELGKIGTMIWNGFALNIANIIVAEGTNLFNGTFIKGLRASDLGKIGTMIWNGFALNIANIIVKEGEALFDGTFVEGLRRSELGIIGTKIWHGTIVALSETIAKQDWDYVGRMVEWALKQLWWNVENAINRFFNMKQSEQPWKPKPKNNNGSGDLLNNVKRVLGFGEGGPIKGPSHEQGGVPLIAEGGEYIIKKSTVDKIGVERLDRLNELGYFANGGLVPQYASGGEVKAVGRNSGGGLGGLGDGFDPNQLLTDWWEGVKARFMTSLEETGNGGGGIGSLIMILLNAIINALTGIDIGRMFMEFMDSIFGSALNDLDLSGIGKFFQEKTQGLIDALSGIFTGGAGALSGGAGGGFDLTQLFTDWWEGVKARFMTSLEETGNGGGGIGSLIMILLNAIINAFTGIDIGRMFMEFMDSIFGSALNDLDLSGIGKFFQEKTQGLIDALSGIFTGGAGTLGSFDPSGPIQGMFGSFTGFTDLSSGLLGGFDPSNSIQGMFGSFTGFTDLSSGLLGDLDPSGAVNDDVFGSFTGFSGKIVNNFDGLNADLNPVQGALNKWINYLQQQIGDLGTGGGGGGGSFLGLFSAGGQINGPSHEQGGVPLIAEGGEYIIKKATVDKIGVGRLDRLNELGYFANGGLVPKFAEGGQVEAEQRAKISASSRSSANTRDSGTLNFQGLLNSVNQWLGGIGGRILGLDPSSAINTMFFSFTSFTDLSKGLFNALNPSGPIQGMFGSFMDFTGLSSGLLGDLDPSNAINDDVFGSFTGFSGEIVSNFDGLNADLNPVQGSLNKWINDLKQQIDDLDTSGGGGSGGFLGLFSAGGLVIGPSHAEGGVPLVAEGGEYIIKKSMVDRLGVERLDRLNEFGYFALGGLVPKFASGGEITPGGPSFFGASSEGQMVSVQNTNNVTVQVGMNGEGVTVETDETAEKIIELIKPKLQDQGLGNMFGYEVMDEIKAIAAGDEYYSSNR